VNNTIRKSVAFHARLYNRKEDIVSTNGLRGSFEDHDFSKEAVRC
jgi:hypothetical protein